MESPLAPLAPRLWDWALPTRSSLPLPLQPLCIDPWPAPTTPPQCPALLLPPFAVLQILLVSSRGIWGSQEGVAREQENTRHSGANKTGWAKHQGNAHEYISGKYPRGFNFPSKVSGNSTASSPPLLFILFLLISNIMELNPLAISSGKKQPSLDSKWPD